MQNDSGELDVSRLLAGDRQSWGKFANRYAPIIYSASFKLLKSYCGLADPEQAADLTQVAKLLKISAHTVRSTKHKALIKLRIYYANVDRDPNKDD